MSQLFPDLPEQKYASPVTLAKWVTAAFVLYIAADLYGVYFFLTEMDLMRDVLAGEGDYSSDEMLAFASKAVTFGAALLGFKVLVIIAWCMWTHKVASNVRAWEGPPLSNSPGWAVGWHFIPILNLWKPYGALREVWDASDPELVSGDDDRWLRPASPAPLFFLGWWLTYLAAGFIDRFANFKLDGETLTSWESGMTYAVAAIVVDLVAAALALLVCWRLTRRQDLRSQGVLPRAEIVTG